MRKVCLPGGDTARRIIPSFLQPCHAAGHFRSHVHGPAARTFLHNEGKHEAHWSDRATSHAAPMPPCHCCRCCAARPGFPISACDFTIVRHPGPPSMDPSYRRRVPVTSECSLTRRYTVVDRNANHSIYPRKPRARKPPPISLVPAPSSLDCLKTSTFQPPRSVGVCFEQHIDLEHELSAGLVPRLSHSRRAHQPLKRTQAHLEELLRSYLRPQSGPQRSPFDALCIASAYRIMGQPIVESTTLLNAQIGFLRTHLALIHIPLSAYPLFVQPILTLLLHNNCRDDEDNVIEPGRPWQFWHPFVNVSITPQECSIVCPREYADVLFRPLVEDLNATLRKAVSISDEDYAVIMIGGEGLEAGQRVLDLTGPLAMAGIPIFFITSYFSDFILVPFSSRPKVIHALEDRGFVFEATDEAGEGGQMTNPASPLLHHRQGSSASSFDFPAPVGTPPPATVPELQTRTFKLLDRHNIHPLVNQSIELITCAGIKGTPQATSIANFTSGKLQLGLAHCLTSFPPPRFFSITLTDSESASLTLEKRLLHFFPNDAEDVLLGAEGPEQIPITLDLKDLPLESTGIVCGVASRLTDGIKGRIGREMFNLSYLSTSRAGHVIVYEDELEDVMEALRGAQLNSETAGDGD